jgi:hypothetical protein
MENRDMTTPAPPDAHFGTADKPMVDWRLTDDPDPDDEEIETPKDVVMMLGFDPAKEAS